MSDATDDFTLRLMFNTGLGRDPFPWTPRWLWDRRRGGGANVDPDAKSLCFAPSREDGMVLLSSTPGDYRSIKRMRADFRRCGLETEGWR